MNPLFLPIKFHDHKTDSVEVNPATPAFGNDTAFKTMLSVVGLSLVFTWQII